MTSCWAGCGTCTARPPPPTTGVAKVGLAAAQSGTYSFVDSVSDGALTLGNGATTQTLNMGTLLDGTVVATGSSVVANFDRLGIQVTLAGPDALGAPGSYVDGDLDGQNLIVESGTGGVFQVGPSDSFVNRIEVGIADLRASGSELNLDTLAVDTISGARQSLATLDRAVNTVSSERGKLGAVQNRLDFAIAYSENEVESISASEASIRDADVALEVTEFSRAQILLQSSNAMLAQANVTAFSALSLL